jgi:hypothetical protein
MYAATPVTHGRPMSQTYIVMSAPKKQASKPKAAVKKEAAVKKVKPAKPKTTAKKTAAKKTTARTRRVLRANAGEHMKLTPYVGAREHLVLDFGGKGTLDVTRVRIAKGGTLQILKSPGNIALDMD